MRFATTFFAISAVLSILVSAIPISNVASDAGVAERSEESQILSPLFRRSDIDHEQIRRRIASAFVLQFLSKRSGTVANAALKTKATSAVHAVATIKGNIASLKKTLENPPPGTNGNQLSTIKGEIANYEKRLPSFEKSASKAIEDSKNAGNDPAYDVNPHDAA